MKGNMIAYALHSTTCCSFIRSRSAFRHQYSMGMNARHRDVFANLCTLMAQRGMIIL